MDGVSAVSGIGVSVVSWAGGSMVAGVAMGSVGTGSVGTMGSVRTTTGSVVVTTSSLGSIISDPFIYASPSIPDDPVKRLFSKFNSTIRGRDGNKGGTRPEKRLFCKCIVVSADQFPIPLGSAPVSLLSFTLNIRNLVSW